MNNKVKRLIFMFLSLMLIAFSSINSFADVGESKIYVTDDANLLTSKEVYDLREELSILSEKWGCDVVVVTTNSTDGKTNAQYADDFFDYNIFSNDGVLLLIDMSTRGWYISTRGTCIDAFTDKGIQWIGDDISPYLSKGDYYKAFNRYKKDCDMFLKQAEKGKPYDVGHMPITKKMIAVAALGSSVFGLIVAAISVFVVSLNNRSVRSVKNAASYVVDGSLKITNSNDVFINKVVTKSVIPRDDDSRGGGSGGGSTIHMGSSGTSHGGGGGHF